MAVDGKTRRREWYERNREAENVRMRDRARETKAALVAKLGGKCMDCGIVGPPEIYDFDHRDPNAKAFSLGSAPGAPERMAAEAEKCDLVCANCHRIRTKNSPAVVQRKQRAHKERRTPTPDAVQELRGRLVKRELVRQPTAVMKARAEEYAKWERKRDARLAK